MADIEKRKLEGGQEGEHERTRGTNPDASKEELLRQQQLSKERQLGGDREQNPPGHVMHPAPANPPSDEPRGTMPPPAGTPPEAQGGRTAGTSDTPSAGRAEERGQKPKKDA